jgi:hypothetical protein
MIIKITEGFFNMVLIEKNRYLFDITNNDNDFRYIFKEFLKIDDLHQNMYLNIVYDLADYQEYR